jgi:hypothetical protein
MPKHTPSCIGKELNTKAVIGLFSLLGICSAAACFAPQRDLPVPAAKAEADNAVKACLSFLEKCGMEAPAGKPVVFKRVKDGRVSSMFVQYGTRPAFTLDEAGSVVYFLGTAKKHEDARRRLRNTVEARAYVKKLGAKIGVDKDWSLVEFTCPLAGEGDTVSSGNTASVSAVWEPMVHGYRLRSGGGKCDLVVDQFDGGILVFAKTQPLKYSIESQKAVLTLKEAKAIAAPVVKKFGVGKPKFPPDAKPRQQTKKSALMFVRPNGEYGGPNYIKTDSPMRYRLAWVLVYDQDDEIWLDAGDGKVLGGILHSGGKYW